MKKLTEKVLVLGIDGMDPRLTNKYLSENAMPNLATFLKRGSAEKGLYMIGGMPTVTPPMWTTLGTGANPSTHGITEYYASGDPGTELDTVYYNFDSTRCKAEPMWNVTAENGLKTLVWHWPGSSWPPTSDNENLHVVDGTQPGGPNVGVGEVEGERMVVASINTESLIYRNKAASDSHVPCFIFGMEAEAPDEMSPFERIHAPSTKTIILDYEEVVEGLSDNPMDLVLSPITEANNWANAPADAKEFIMLYSKGLIRRPCLILKNEYGIYDHIAIYKSKKDTTPIVILPHNVFVRDVIDEAIKDDHPLLTNRNMRALEISPDGTSARIWVSAAMDFSNDTVWHPTSLLKQITTNVGYPQPVSMAGGSDERLIADCTRANWEAAADWNAASLNYLINTNGYQVVFSHFHNIDLQGHLLVQYLKTGIRNLSGVDVQRLFREVYLQTDRYIGKFLHFLDKGWTIMIVSDHGQICPEHHKAVLCSGPSSINAITMRDLGYTVMIKDENGNDTKEIDWSKTTAVMQRTCQIYINLKGREPHGIVDPKDKFELEEKIMTDLYNLKDFETGHRICSLAIRNREAILLGTGGEGSGDILFYIAEGYNDDHVDSLSTLEGSCDTSVSSIFAAAGPGIKEDFRTKRVIKHIDIVPTIALMLGLHTPAQCEGAPIYQILTGSEL